MKIKTPFSRSYLKKIKLCITSITNSCWMGLFIVVANTVTRWSYRSVGKYLLAVI